MVGGDPLPATWCRADDAVPVVLWLGNPVGRLTMASMLRNSIWEDLSDTYICTVVLDPILAVKVPLGLIPPPSAAVRPMLVGSGALS